jgi:hypothetical protein
MAKNGNRYHSDKRVQKLYSEGFEASSGSPDVPSLSWQCSGVDTVFVRKKRNQRGTIGCCRRSHWTLKWIQGYPKGTESRSK